MRRISVILTILFLLCGVSPAWGALSETKQVVCFKNVEAAVSQTGQKQVLIVPTEPLEFDTTLEWELEIAKKGLSVEKEAAVMVVEELKPTARTVARHDVSGKGKLKIPKGVQYRITINAGEYSVLMIKSGTETKLKVNYPEAIIKYTPGDAPYRLELEVQGPEEASQWNWYWDAGGKGQGKKVTHQFTGGGKVPVLVEGKLNKAPSVSRKFYFELDVPPLIDLKPKVGPLEGAVELKVDVKAEAIVNYSQKATYTWNFGNGIEVTGAEANNTYNRPGKYHLLLSAKVGGYTIDRSWLVEAAPLTVKNNLVITPHSGPAPLDVNASINPIVSGGPTKLKYTWEIADEVMEGGKFSRKFTEPGEYRVLLKAVDQLHPDLVIPEEIVVVKVTPPELAVKPSVAISKGLIPLTANFQANLEVKGGPVELVYRWDFGDGEIALAENPTHTFKKPGLYQVQLIVSDRRHPGNLTVGTVPVEVLVPEMKVSAGSNLTNGLVPLEVNFNAQIAVSGSPCEPQYYWDFGDGEISLEKNPVHIYRREGKFPVTLEVRDGLHPGNTVKTNLEIETKLPKLRLTAAVVPNNGAAPLKVQCRAWADKEGTASNSGIKYYWEFGDGGKGEGGETSHTYTKPGTYNVAVIAVDETLGLMERKNLKVIVE